MAITAIADNMPPNIIGQNKARGRESNILYFHIATNNKAQKTKSPMF